jgi:hypothetical protein
MQQRRHLVEPHGLPVLLRWTEVHLLE